MGSRDEVVNGPTSENRAPRVENSSALPWTSAQRAAIEHLAGDLLVSAAAGSGKTAVLAERCARLVTRDGSDRTTVDRLLVLTFTEAAADEMRTRIADALEKKLAETPNPAAQAKLENQKARIPLAHISTLHAFCARVLRSYFHEAHLDPAFEVFDEDEARLLRDDIIEQVLARWHQDDAGTIEAPLAAAFADFYEAFAQGDDVTLASFIRRLHAMLESVPDPAAWLAAARDTYSESGATTTRARYIAEVARELFLRVAACDRHLAEIARAENCRSLLTDMQGYRDLIAAAAADLTARGVAAWDSAAAQLRAFSWPRLNTPKDAPDFSRLKEQIREPAKKDLEKLRHTTFAAFNSADRLLADLRALAAPLDVLLRITQDFQGEYTAAKRRQNRLDFADLERLTLDLLTRSDSAAAQDLRARFDHILVDEFQDINPLQAALLTAVRDPEKHARRGNLFVVGDVKQAIYGFRLADPEQFLDREHTARATATHTAFLSLQHNFRSRPALLAHLNAVFERLLTPEVAGVNYAAGHALHAPEESDHSGLTGGSAPDSEIASALNPFTTSPIECHILLPDAPDEPDPSSSPSLIENRKSKIENSSDAFESDSTDPDTPAEFSAATQTAMEQEARMVADRITDLMRENRGVRDKSGQLRPLRYRDIAILLRGVCHRAPLFTRALAEKGIPVHADLSTGFFDAEEISHTLALLSLLDNPRQDIPLATVMLSPYFHFTPEGDSSGNWKPQIGSSPLSFSSFTHDDLALIRLAFPNKTEVPFHQAVINLLTEIPLGSAVPFPPIENRGEGKSKTENPTLLPRLHAFFALLDRYRRWVRSAPLHEALADILRDQHLLTYVTGLSDGRQRAANLQALHQRALQFAGFRKQGLHRFLHFIKRLRESDGDFGEAPILSEASDVVRIMTIHKSKGLEFPVVFVSTLGSKFNLDRSGPILIDRDEHIGLQFADVPRNLFRPTAASALITASRRRTSRAEELRLLYVAMTRARDHLILTGSIKHAAYERLRATAPTHSGPLPEDTLLRANTFLDYLIPVAAVSDLQSHIHLTTHTPTTAAPLAPGPEIIARVTQLQQHQPLESSSIRIPPQTILTDLLARLTNKYAHDLLTRRPAKVSVSELKRSLFSGEELPDTDLATFEATGQTASTTSAHPPSPIGNQRSKIENVTAPTPSSALSPQSDSPAIARGIATHRLLELLDFATVHDAATLDAFLADQLRVRRLLPDQAALIDLDQIRWFLTTPLAAQLRATPTHLHREIPFIYPLSPADIFPAIEKQKLEIENPADAPLLRGIIDLLLVTPDAIEIVDYKTDSPHFLPAHLPAYRLQMYYYARAAAAILRRPITRATLVLLAAREILLIENPAARPNSF